MHTWGAGTEASCFALPKEEPCDGSFAWPLVHNMNLEALFPAINDTMGESKYFGRPTVGLRRQMTAICAVWGDIDADAYRSRVEIDGWNPVEESSACL